MFDQNIQSKRKDKRFSLFIKIFFSKHNNILRLVDSVRISKK